MTNATTDRPVEVLVLAGGLSHERDVSLRSGARVADALRDAGLSTTVADVDSELLTLVDTLRPDVVWPLLHGSTGEDGSIRDLLELVGVAAVAVPQQASLDGDAREVAQVYGAVSSSSTAMG